MFEEEEIDDMDDSTVDENDLDLEDNESEDIKDEPLDDDPEGNPDEDEDAPDPKDEAQIARVLATLEGRDLKEIAKQLLHTQRLASHKAQEAKANQVAADDPAAGQRRRLEGARRALGTGDGHVAHGTPRPATRRGTQDPRRGADMGAAKGEDT